MAIRKDAKVWTDVEKRSLYDLHKNLKPKDVKEQKFRELAKELGRTFQAVSKRYYILLKNNAFAIYESTENIKEAISYDVKKNQNKVKYEVFWTKERMNILCEKLKERKEKETTYKEMIFELMKEFSFSRASIENKIRLLKQELRVNNWEQLIQKIESGQVSSKIKNRVYKKMQYQPKKINYKNKKKETFNGETIMIKHDNAPTQDVQEHQEIKSNLNIVDINKNQTKKEIKYKNDTKKSLFQTLKHAYLSYKISKLENKIKKLKAILENF